jgi:hypothetical protein
LPHFKDVTILNPNLLCRKKEVNDYSCYQNSAQHS